MNRLPTKTIFISLVILTLIFLFFFYVFLSGVKPTTQTQIDQTTPTPTISADQPTIVPLVNYRPGSLDTAAKKVTSRQPLSQDDSAKKTALVILSQSDGTITATQDFKVEYLSSLDIFQVQILTTDIAKAKQDAISWFKNQGFSDTGICNLPVVFYLNHDIAQKLQGTNTVFNPLPDSCK